MSGGYFDHDQFRINEIAVEINRLIETNECAEKNEWGDAIGKFYSKETIEQFKEARATLLEAYAYTHCIDWLLSGDDCEESFAKRLKDLLSVIRSES